MLILFDFECRSCGGQFEELADRNHPDSVKCPLCASSDVQRLIYGARIDPRLGVNADAFPSLGAAWERKRRERMAIEKKRYERHGSYE